MKISKTIFTAVLSFALAALINTAVFAHTGRGTESDPYIITDYKEFAELSQANIPTTDTPKETWYRLGCDISTDEDSVNTYLIQIGDKRCFESYMHLDLAGHTISRSGTTTDLGMFWLYSGKLFLDDSEGSGRIECSMRSNSEYGAIFYLQGRSSFYPGADLIINGGTFKTAGSAYPCVLSYSSNGSITINDGTFINGSVSTGIDMRYNSKTDVCIKGGTFSRLLLSDLGTIAVYDCTVNDEIYTSNSRLKYIIDSASTVTNNGAAVTDLDIQGLTGKTVIKSPNKHTITYSANGGSGEMRPLSAYTGDTYTFPACEFTAPEGHYFDKWQYGGNYYSVGAAVEVTGDMTVKPHWIPREYIVSFITGNACIVPEQTVSYGNCASEPDKPICYNGKYVQYWTDAQGNKFNFGTEITANTFLYAQWAAVSNSVTGLTNGQTYAVYYGDDVILRETPARTAETVWSVTVDGKSLLVKLTPEDSPIICTITKKSVAAGKTAAVVYKETINAGLRPSTTTKRVNLTYVYKQGDIDGDGDVDNADAALYLKHLGGTKPFTAEQAARADVNGDNKKDMLDVIAILNK